MADKNKKKKGGAAKWLLLPILAIAAFLLRDCIPGFGWGGNTGDGSDVSSAESASSAAPSATVSVTPSASASSSAPTIVVVKGDRCGDEDCAEVCKRLLAGEGEITIDATSGSHATVEELKVCLEEGGREPNIQTK